MGKSCWQGFSTTFRKLLGHLQGPPFFHLVWLDGKFWCSEVICLTCLFSYSFTLLKYESLQEQATEHVEAVAMWEFHNGQVYMQLNEKPLWGKEKYRQRSKLEWLGALLGERCISTFKGTFPSQCLSDGLGVVTLWPQRVCCRDRQSSFHPQMETTTLSKLTQPRSIKTRGGLGSAG